VGAATILFIQMPPSQHFQSIVGRSCQVQIISLATISPDGLFHFASKWIRGEFLRHSGFEDIHSTNNIQVAGNAGK
jgi:hypothetical protein